MILDDRLFAYIFSKQPAMNPVITKGIAVQQMANPEAYIDKIWKCAAPMFPEGLTYVQYERCSPYEHYVELTRERQGRKNEFDVSRSDVYMVKFKFDFEGEPIERFMLMPFVSAGGTIHIRGTEYTISPVLIDRSISVTGDKIFIPINRDRLNFERFSWNINVNGVVESQFLYWSKIHNDGIKPGAKKHPDFIDGVTSLPHYLFARFGFTRVFTEFAGVLPVVGGYEINSSNYPPDQWTIFKASGNQPMALRRKAWAPNGLRIAIRNEEVSEVVKSLITGFYYIADLFPLRVTLEDLDEERLWRTLWGLLQFGPESEGVLVSRTSDHLDSLDKYLDEESRRELFRDGLPCHDIYELFWYVMENMTEIILNDDGNRMDGKRLTTLKYVMFDIVYAIFKLSYSLNPKNRKLSKKDLITRFNKGLNAELILRINSGHGEISSVVTPTDSMILKHTSSIIRQTAVNRGESSDDHSGNFDDPSLNPDASFTVCGSFQYLPKNTATGDSRLNCWGEVSPEGELEIRPEDRAMVNELRAKLSTK